MPNPAMDLKRLFRRRRWKKRVSTRKKVLQLQGPCLPSAEIPREFRGARATARQVCLRDDCSQQKRRGRCAASCAANRELVSTVFTRLVTQKPMVTAGLKCPPEMWPSAETITPMARPWPARAEKTEAAGAMPNIDPCRSSRRQRKSEQNVPRNSAISFAACCTSIVLHAKKGSRARFERLAF